MEIYRYIRAYLCVHATRGLNWVRAILFFSRVRLEFPLVVQSFPNTFLPLSGLKNHMYLLKAYSSTELSQEGTRKSASIYLPYGNNRPSE